MKNIQNPGSAIGEAIGAQMEKALNRFLNPLCSEMGYLFISSSLIKGKRKLLMYDNFGTAFNIDAVITNESMQPIILFESKYIRYKKHNRDKGSWLCTAHPAIRRRYQSIRSSIAVLAGNWSSTSLAMMQSFDINIFLIPFEKICGFLATYGIVYDWDEKDRIAAQSAWQKYSQLSESQQTAIGEQMADLIKENLKDLIMKILDNTVGRKIEKVTVELHSNLGEVKIVEFESVNDAVAYLNSEEIKTVFVETGALTIFDQPVEKSIELF